MGMHEFEYGADMAVEILDETAAAGTDIRSMYYSLAKFTGQWDAAFQHFHVLPYLLKHRFTYVIPVQEHPDYQLYQSYFDQLHGYVNINRDPEEDWSPDNPAIAMYCHPTEAWGEHFDGVPEPFARKGMLYFDAGSELWQRMADAGKLSGTDLAAPQELPVEAVIEQVVRGAQQQKRTDIISYWYPLITTALFLKPATAKVWMQNTHLVRIREIVIATEAYKKDNDYGAPRLPQLEDFRNNFRGWDADAETAAFFQWWYAPLREWLENPLYGLCCMLAGNQLLNDVWRGVNEQGNEALQNGSFDIQLNGALAFYRRAQKVNPLSWRLEHNIALCNWYLGYQDKSIEHFTRSIELNSQNDEGYALRAALCQFQGRTDLCEADKATARAINPDNRYLKEYFPGEDTN